MKRGSSFNAADKLCVTYSSMIVSIAVVSLVVVVDSILSSLLQVVVMNSTNSWVVPRCKKLPSRTTSTRSDIVDKARLRTAFLSSWFSIPIILLLVSSFSSVLPLNTFSFFAKGKLCNISVYKSILRAFFLANVSIDIDDLLV